MKQQNRYYMNAAIELAKQSTMEQRHGAIVVNEKCRDRPIVARGINEHVFNMEDRKVFSRHAEMSCVASLIAMKGHNSRFFDNCTVFVARVGARDEVRFSKPCKKCQRLLQKIGIKKIYYTYDENTVCTLEEWDEL